MIYKTDVHMSPSGTGHEHIADVKWCNPSDSTTGTSSRETVVYWIEHQSGDARVQDGQGDVHVAVVNATPKYLRTHADGRWTDNLLALPRY